MHTVFEVYIISEDEEYAHQAARAAFREVDRLEEDLSRFRENSDVSRLNVAPENTPVTLGLDTFANLERAAEIHQMTSGVFDVAIGALYACWLNPDKSLRNPLEKEIQAAVSRTGMNHLILDSEWLSAEKDIVGVQFDLGGIGKGYAADKMGELLEEEWGLSRCLIIGGASSVLALDPPSESKDWPLNLRNPLDPNEILLKTHVCRRAVAGSGLAAGRHIIDPRPPRSGPIEGRHAAWASAPDAVTADALSTSFMIMSLKEIQTFSEANPEYAAMVFNPLGQDPAGSDEKQVFGNWECS
jgi:thiamine biosynthesis lipoprotein